MCPLRAGSSRKDPAMTTSVDVTLLVLVVEVATDGTDAGTDEGTSASLGTEGADEGSTRRAHEGAATGAFPGRGATTGEGQRGKAKESNGKGLFHNHADLQSLC